MTAPVRPDEAWPDALSRASSVPASSPIETVLLLLVTVASLAVAAWLARRPARAGVGILLGTATGLVLLLALSALVGFLAYVLPFGQIGFWAARLFAR